MIRYLTAGESHGQALVGILEGLPAGLDITATYIDANLARRQKGFGRGGRMKIERDHADILSGVRLGKTIGSPIALLIRNKDWENWQDQMAVEPAEIEPTKITLPRPGHADLAGIQKFGFDDIRPVIERSSARETAMRVGLGSLARKFLEAFNIHVASHVYAIGEAALYDGERMDLGQMPLTELRDRADRSDVHCLDAACERRMIDQIRLAQQNGDSLGGLFEVIVEGVPPGLGSYTHWDLRLDAVLAQHVLSIPAVKAVEIGDGWTNASRYGSQVHDEIFFDSKKGYYRGSNRSGGIEGGMSTGERMIIRAAMKPLPTLARPLKSVDIVTKAPGVAHKERTDTVSVPAAAVVAEAVAALALVNPFLEKFGGHTVDEIRQRFEAKQTPADSQTSGGQP